MICIVNHGVGNVGAIRNMLKKAGIVSQIVSRPEEVAVADRIILPGVGSFDSAIARMHASGLVEALEKRVRGDGVPFLGICLGMQLLMSASDEGSRPGLGWLPGAVRKFHTNGGEGGTIRVPHMGWNTVEPSSGCRLLEGGEPHERFYFLHSYYVDCFDQTDVAGITEYGRSFVSAIVHQNLHGVQFHPEKSHRFGMRILENFVNHC